MTYHQDIPLRLGVVWNEMGVPQLGFLPKVSQALARLGRKDDAFGEGILHTPVEAAADYEASDDDRAGDGEEEEESREECEAVYEERGHSR